MNRTAYASIVFGLSLVASGFGPLLQTNVAAASPSKSELKSKSKSSPRGAVNTPAARPMRRPVEPPAARASQPLTWEADLPAVIEADDLAFVAEVSAAEVHFEIVPKRIDVTLSGPKGGKKLFYAIRDNIPKPAKPGVTYRNVRVRVVISSSLPDANLVLEHLEQVPLAPAQATSPGSASQGVSQ
jgi:hypothetical protein